MLYSVNYLPWWLYTVLLAGVEVIEESALKSLLLTLTISKQTDRYKVERYH